MTDLDNPATDPSPEAPPIRRRRWLIPASIVIGVLIVFAVGMLVSYALFGTSDDDHTYDEIAHRAAIEMHLGHPVADWPTYREVVFERCESDALWAVVATAPSEGDLERVVIDFQFACPHRVPELEELLRAVSQP